MTTQSETSFSDPQGIGNAFVKKFYTVLHNEPTKRLINFIWTRVVAEQLVQSTEESQNGSHTVSQTASPRIQDDAPKKSYLSVVSSYMQTRIISYFFETGKIVYSIRMHDLTRTHYLGRENVHGGRNFGKNERSELSGRTRGSTGRNGDSSENIYQNGGQRVAARQDESES